MLGGPRLLVDAVKPWDYLVSVWRAPGSDVEVYPTRLRDRLPRIRVPLRTGDADAVLDLQAAFAHAYDTGPYPDRVDHEGEPPPLSRRRPGMGARAAQGQRSMLSGTTSTGLRDG